MQTVGIDTAVILCGGRGTRLGTASIPKPLVEVGGLPIVWHVASIFAAQGVERVLLLTGYRAELVAAFAARRRWPAGVAVECVDTGPDTPTGGRVLAAAGPARRRAVLPRLRRRRRGRRPRGARRAPTPRRARSRR